jgi:glycosyltransferase involved in cell wall biosynthesis
MQTNTPLVSIIMPTYNAEKFISKSIQSVLNQTYQNWELIVVNDGSKDNTSKVVESFDDKRILLIKQKNSGVSKARNIGIKNAKGAYIAFLDSDDLWLKKKLEIQVNYMLNHPNIVLSYTYYNSFVGDDTVVKNKQLYPFKINNLNERLLVFNFIATLTVMVKSDVLKDIGGFDTQLFGPEDWDLWIKVSQKGNIGYINQNLALYREHDGGISKSKARQLEEEYKVLLRHVLKSENQRLIKYAMWFYNLKLTNFYFSQGDIKSFLSFYMQMIRLLPFKVENITYPLKKLLKI